MAIEKFIDELGSDLNKFQVTTEDGSTYEIKLLRKANITQVGTPLNANKLNQLVNGINANTTSISNLSTVARTGSYNDLSNKPTSLPASDVYDWAKASTKPTYTASEVGAYSKTEIDTNLDAKQNKIDANNKIDYSMISNTPTIPSKLSGLTNDINNIYLRDNDWERVENNRLTSSGLYLLQVHNSSSFGTPVNLGLVFFNGAYDLCIGFLHFYDEYFRVTMSSSGDLKLEKYEDEYLEVPRTSFYYIRLS